MKNKGIVCVSSLLIAGLAYADGTVLTLGTEFGGRFINESLGFDYTPGNPTAPTASPWRTDRANLGDNPLANEFLQVWAFVVTTDFAADIANGADAVFAFDTGVTNNLRGIPTETTVYLLDYNNATGTSVSVEQATAALEAPNPTVLGSFTFSIGEEVLEYTVANASLASISAEDRIYFALDNLLSDNGIADFFKPGSGGGSANGLADITLTTVGGTGPASATFVSLHTAAAGVLEVELDTPTPDLTFLYSKTALTDAAWTNAPHSDNAGGPFVATNLTYSAAGSGSNILIYVESAEAAAFFGAGPASD